MSVWRLLLVGLLLGQGCQQPAPEKSAQPTSAPDTSAPPTEAPSRARHQRHCLTPPEDTTSPVAERLLVKQQEAQTRPDDPLRWTSLGVIWIEMDRLHPESGYGLIIDACAEAALTLAPEHPQALELRVFLLQSQHRFAEAQTIAEQILEQDPDSILALGLLSDILIERGDYDRAKNLAQRRADLAPGPDALARASYFAFLEGDAETAKKLIRDALATGRNAKAPEPTAWAFTEAAMLFWHEGDYAGADLVYQEALKWLPDYPAALVGRGRVAISQGKGAEAIPHLEKAMSLAPSAETAWLLGDAYALAGQDEKSQKAYADLVRLGAEDPLMLASYYATHHLESDKALELIEAELPGRGSIYTHDTHAWVLYRAGRLDEAAAASQRATALGTGDARLLYHAGAIAIARGEVEAGREGVARALELNPGFDRVGVAEARALIEAQKGVQR